MNRKATRRRLRRQGQRDWKKRFRRSKAYLELAHKENRQSDYDRAMRSWKRHSGCSGVPGIPVPKQEREAYYASQGVRP